VVVVVEVGNVEDEVLWTTVVVGLPAVACGEAAEQETRRMAAMTAAARVSHTIRTSMNRISADAEPSGDPR
jgi:hypothetical protein